MHGLCWARIQLELENTSACCCIAGTLTACLIQELNVEQYWTRVATLSGATPPSESILNNTLLAQSTACIINHQIGCMQGVLHTCEDGDDAFIVCFVSEHWRGLGLLATDLWAVNTVCLSAWLSELPTVCIHIQAGLCVNWIISPLAMVDLQSPSTLDCRLWVQVEASTHIIERFGRFQVQYWPFWTELLDSCLAQ